MFSLIALISNIINHIEITLFSQKLTVLNTFNNLGEFGSNNYLNFKFIFIKYKS